MRDLLLESIGLELEAVEGVVVVGADLPVGVVDESLAGVAGIGSQRPTIEFVVLEGRRAFERVGLTGQVAVVVPAVDGLFVFRVGDQVQELGIQLPSSMENAA